MVRLTLATLLGLLGCGGPDVQSGAAQRSRGGCEGVTCSLEALIEDNEQRQPWRVHEAASFRIFHYDERVAARLAREAERARLAQLRNWLGDAPLLPWSPRCDIYLFPTRKLLVKLSGGDSKTGSALSAPSRLYRGRMVSRRINLAADDPWLFVRTLPHEISHVVLDGLLGRDAPLWAHEGLATLEEPEESQQAAEAVVASHQAAGRTFPLQALLGMSRYPDREYLQLFYSQSFSVVRFLVEAGGRARLLAFLRGARPGRVEAALRQEYGWGYAELEQLWTQSVASRR